MKTEEEGRWDIVGVSSCAHEHSEFTWPVSAMLCIALPWLLQSKPADLCNPRKCRKHEYAQVCVCVLKHKVNDTYSMYVRRLLHLIRLPD